VIARVKGWQIFVMVALVGAFLITRGLVAQPGFTDAFYHYNAAERLVSGEGLTDDYLWVYIGAPDSLPAPSHIYWMPLTSLSAALGIAVLNAPDDYTAAQLAFVLMLAGAACTGYWLGARLGGKARHAWMAGLVTLLGGFYMRFWGATDTFVPYALVGSLCLVCMGLGVKVGRTSERDDPLRYKDQNPHPPTPSPLHREGEENSSLGRTKLFVQQGRGEPAIRTYVWFAVSGALVALGHLTRADGLLLLLVGWVVIVWEREMPFSKRLLSIAVLTLVYLLVMLPWFVRNLSAVGSPLPVGGTQGIWYGDYNDLFNYPPDASPQTFFADGLGLLLSTRWEALLENLKTFVAIEGMIVLTPLMLIGLWVRRRDGFLRGFWLYALGLHLAMTLLFPFPGIRGGLFHSASALLPWWAALGAAGLDDAVDWIARRRKNWKAGTAKWIFSAALLGFIVILSLMIALPRRVNVGTPSLYTWLMGQVPPDARVMINDPAQLYYFTKRGGVVLPNEAPDVIPEIARKYGVRYLLLEGVTENGQAQASQKLWPILTDDYDFLIPVALDYPGVKLYEIRY
jgi:hypothetical protein